MAQGQGVKHAALLRIEVGEYDADAEPAVTAFLAALGDHPAATDGTGGAGVVTSLEGSGNQGIGLDSSRTDDPHSEGTADHSGRLPDRIFSQE